MSTLQNELEERLADLGNLEEQNKKLSMELSVANDQLHREKDRCSLIDKQRATQEAQIKDLENRLDDVETSSARNSKKQSQKLEQRISELELLVDAEQRRTDEANKLVKKHERRVKELLLQLDEEQKAKLQLQDVSDQMQVKMKAFKRQVDDAVSFSNSKRLSIT